jgi:hypothetical protein
MTTLLEEFIAQGRPCGSHPLREQSDVWGAVRAFFASSAVPVVSEAAP